MRLLISIASCFFVCISTVCQEQRTVVNEEKKNTQDQKPLEEQKGEQKPQEQKRTEEQKTVEEQKSVEEKKLAQELKPEEKQKGEEQKTESQKSTQEPKAVEKAESSEKKESVQAKAEEKPKPVEEKTKPEEQKPQEQKPEQEGAVAGEGPEKLVEQPAGEAAIAAQAKGAEVKIFPQTATFESKEAPDTPESMAEAFTKEEPEEGLDTITLEEPQGNWLYKRTWWERAQGRYEKIRVLVDSIWESRMNFFIMRSEFDRTVVDPFYTSIGIGQGELQELIKEMIEALEKDGISRDEREVYEKLEEQREALQQLALDVESVADFDEALDKALRTLMDQINRVRGFEKQAWENFKEIAQVLSDIKAQELAFMMDGLWQNIKNIGVYLEKDFTPHFTKLMDDARGLITRVQDQIKVLKEKGVDFKAQSERIIQKEEEDKIQNEVQKERQKEKKSKKAEGWLDIAINSFLWIGDMIISIVRLPYDLIFSSKK